jgi:hypothetical protein
VTIRRVTVFFALLIFAAFAASGQIIDWTGATSYSQPMPNSPTGCILPSGVSSSTTTCISGSSNYSQQFQVLGGPGGTITWSTNGALPAGLGINSSTGLFSGTPLSAGPYSFTVTASYSGGTSYTSQTTYSIYVPTANATVTVTPFTLPAFTAGTPITPVQLTAAGGGGSYTWAFAAGSQQDALVLSTTGILSGTPASGGSFPVTIVATDSFNNQGSYSTSFVVGGASSFLITTTSLPSGNTNASYSTTLFESGGPSSGITWTILSGNLPPGLQITSNNTTATISGTPTTAGPYSFVVQASNGTVSTPQQTLSITIGTAFVITTTSLPNATAGANYSQTLYESGGPGNGVVWSVVSGNLPPGMSIITNTGSTGTISGTPTTANTYNFTVQASYTSNGTTFTAPQALSLVVGNGLAITTTSLPNANNGTAYSQTLTQTGGPNSGVSWTITAGGLPSGLTISSNANGTATISGTPTLPNTYTFTVQASYVSGSTTISATQALSILVLNTLALPNPSSVSGTVGQTVTLQFTATGGTTPYRYTLLSGTLPAGVTLNASTGAVSGIPTQIGTSTFVIQVTDNTGITATATGSITVTTKLTMANPPTTTAGINQNISLQFAASGGITPYTFLLQSGVLPPGLVLNQQTGQVTGIATQVGTYTFTVLATDSSSPAQTATATGTITISTPLTMATPATVSGIVGQNASVQFTAAGGTPPYTYAFSAGTLPTGLTLNPQTGLLSGQATQAGTFVFLIQATDSANLQITAQGTVNVVLASISSVTITPSGALNAATQVPVTVTLPAPIGQQITGSLVVQFIRPFDGQASREVQFTNGAQFVNFTVPANTTQVPLPAGFALITGTATGTGQIGVTFRDSLGNNITSPNVQAAVFSIAGTAPVISSFKISLPVNGIYTATVTGYSSTLSMTTGAFTFTPTTGTNLASSTISVPLANAFAAWYNTSQSNQYGGQFSLTVPFAFTVSGGTSTNPIDAASVTLTNSAGTSAAKSANPQ